MNLLRYLSKFIGSVLLLILVVIAVVFAVSNRTAVTISLWPLPIETSLQLGATVLVALALGIIVGTALMSLSRFKFRHQAKTSQRRVATLEKKAHDASGTLPAVTNSTPRKAPRAALEGQ